MPDVRGQGIGTLLVSLLSRQLQSQGVLPFYGTAMSHIASQRLALRAGFFPAWTELTTERIPTDRTPAGRGR